MRKICGGDLRAYHESITSIPTHQHIRTPEFQTDSDLDGLLVKESSLTLHDAQGHVLPSSDFPESCESDQTSSTRWALVPLGSGLRKATIKSANSVRTIYRSTCPGPLFNLICRKCRGSVYSNKAFWSPLKEFWLQSKTCMIALHYI